MVSDHVWKQRRWRVGRLGVACVALTISGCATVGAPRPNYDQYAWPPPPDTARIKLDDVIFGRQDVATAQSGIRRALLGQSASEPFDRLRRPFGVAFDSVGRILVTDQAGALFRFDRAKRVAETFGTEGALALKTPLGIGIGPDGTIYVADGGLKRVLAFDPQGRVTRVFGKEGELQNPTDAEPSADGKAIFVADAKGHELVVFDTASGERLRAIGSRGGGEGQFNFPTSLAHDRTGNLLVLDQANARVQVLTEAGDFVEAYGERGQGFGSFVRPKDVAVDEAGFIYITDADFCNVQIFDSDWNLLVFVGSPGRDIGKFGQTAGVAVQGDRFAVADRLGGRVQVFRFVVAKDLP